MISCEPFRAADAMAIAPPRASRFTSLEEFERTVTEYEALGNAYTLRRDGAIVACGGVVGTPSGNYLWSVIAPGASPVTLHRAAVRFMRIFGAFDLLTIVECNHERARRWVERLGFVPRRVVADFGGVGHDHVEYVRAGQ